VALDEMDREDVLRLCALTKTRIEKLGQKALKRLKEKKGMPARPEDDEAKAPMAAINRMIRDILPDEKETGKEGEGGD
jgi:hypothetical protein